MVALSTIDQGFAAASPFLKDVLKECAGSNDFKSMKCLDVPSGDGRNTLLLAESFSEVLAIDINERYLKRINEHCYQRVNTLQSDVLNERLKGVPEFGFICNIHFYSEKFTLNLLQDMGPNAYLLLETPACHGENFRTLPTERELDRLFREVKVLRYEFKLCKHVENKEGRGKLKALLKIKDHA